MKYAGRVNIREIEGKTGAKAKTIPGVLVQHSVVSHISPIPIIIKNNDNNKNVETTSIATITGRENALSFFSAS